MVGNRDAGVRQLSHHIATHPLASFPFDDDWSATHASTVGIGFLSCHPIGRTPDATMRG